MQEIGRERHGSMAVSFHLKMGKALAMPAQCFHVRFESESSERHLLAFRDFSDQMPQVTGAQELREDIKMQVAGAVPVVEFSAVDFDVLAANQAFCELWAQFLLVRWLFGRSEGCFLSLGAEEDFQKYPEFTEYVAKSSRDRFLQALDTLKREHSDMA